MIYLIIILIALTAFLSGFILGSAQRKGTENATPIKKQRESVQLQREYENFLNYDGTEQE